jgi:hypothetical protein
MSCRAFFLFAPAFKDWPFLIAEEMEKEAGPIELCGLVTGTEGTYRHVTRRLHAAGQRQLDHLAALEHQWLATPVDEARLQHYEAYFGVEEVRRLIISDRHLGAGFVSGARLPETGLNRAAASPTLLCRYVVGLLDYLSQLFTTSRPSVTFCYAVAGAPAYAVSLFCKKLGIPFLRLTQTRIGRRYVCDSSVRGLMTEVAELHEESGRDPSLIADQMEAAREFITGFRAQPETRESVKRRHAVKSRNLSARHLMRSNIAPLKPLLMPRSRPKVRSLRHPTHWQQARHTTATWFEARRILGDNTFCAAEQLPTSRYVYFPLHVDPEASTMLFAPYHTDQMNVIESLAKATPTSMKMVVKEHWPMVGLRPPEFYRRLKRIPGVVLAHPKANSLSLILRADATVVLTSTAAWESLLLAKPAVVIGDTPFSIVRDRLSLCPELTALPRKLAEALRPEEFDDESLTRYVAAVLKLSFELPWSLLWGGATEADLAHHRSIATTIAQRMLAAMQASSREEEAAYRLHYAETKL